MSIQEQIEKCQRGQYEAFAEVYQHFTQKIYSFLFYKTLSHSLAEDLTSDTFIKALENIEKFDSQKGPFQAWLFTIARNNLYDHYRSHKETQSINDAWEIPVQENSTHDTEISMLKDELQSKMLHLTPQQREIITLRFWQDLSFKEIGLILGKSEGSVKVAANRAVKSLKQHFPIFLLLSIRLTLHSSLFTEMIS